MICKTVIFNQNLEVNTKTKTLTIDGTEYQEKEVKKVIADYIGINRLYKPIAIVFYSDMINGKTKNWNLI